MDEFCLAFIEASIGQTGVLSWPVGWRLAYDMGDALGMVMRARGDLAAALAVLDAGPDPAAALHIANLRSNVLWTHGEHRFMSAFWEDYPAEARLLGEFLMRETVPPRLEAAVDLVTDERHFDVLAQGMF